MRYRDPLITLMCSTVQYKNQVFENQNDLLNIFDKDEFVFSDENAKFQKYHCLCGVDVVSMAKVKKMPIVQTSFGYCVGEEACKSEIERCDRRKDWYKIH